MTISDNENVETVPELKLLVDESTEWHPLPEIESEHICSMIFTHSSPKINKETKTEHRDYERLEYVGDAVLNLALAYISYQLYPHIDPAALTSIKISIASNTSLARISSHYELSSRMNWDPSVLWLDSTKGNRPVAAPAPHTKVHADLFEAYIGGVFLDQGYNKALSWLTSLFTPLVQQAYNSYVESLTLKNRLILEYGQSIREWEGTRRQILWKASLNIGQELVGQAVATTRSEARRLIMFEALTKTADAVPVPLDTKSDSEIHNALHKYAQRYHMGKRLEWNYMEAGERWISRATLTNGTIVEKEAKGRFAAEQMVAKRIAGILQKAGTTIPGAGLDGRLTNRLQKVAGSRLK